MKASIVLFAVVVSLGIAIIGCGGVDMSITPTVHAQGPGTPDCTPEFFFDGPQNSPGGGAIETAHTLWIVTPACVITAPVDQSYTTKFPHHVQLLTVQMGSNAGSLFEWDQVVTITDPSGNVLLAQQQQYDKHQDTRGNEQQRYPYSNPISIPIGSTVRITRRAEPETSCIQPGPFGTRNDCVTGGGIQLQD